MEFIFILAQNFDTLLYTATTSEEGQIKKKVGPEKKYWTRKKKS